MIPLEAERVPQRLNDDPEFRLCARYWNGSVHLHVGEKAYVLRIAGGQVMSLGTEKIQLEPRDIEVSAPEQAWSRFLQPVPPPFYQDLIAASMHHGFAIGGDPETLFAYYPAIRRMFDVLREDVGE
jgi:hypothetical protein